MALLQSSIIEDILTRQERAVIRGIYRASQLAEAAVTLRKTYDTYKGSTVELPAGSSRVPNIDNVKLLESYLSSAINVALASIKIPARPSATSLSSNKDTTSV